MSGLSPRLPLSVSTEDGFTLVQDIRTLVKQNLKMLILTSPGERVMEPDYGVGMKNFLFENSNQNSYRAIEQKIIEQVGKYMPVVKIKSINFDDVNIDNNTLGIQIQFSIDTLGVTDFLAFTI
tara:strand:+ start:3213 stop:3581 length:369 start_codon:yes stop_codon:yes gene_type:complete